MLFHWEIEAPLELGAESRNISDNTFSGIFIFIRASDSLKLSRRVYVALLFFFFFFFFFFFLFDIIFLST
jgi:hypothetical protein